VGRGDRQRWSKKKRGSSFPARRPLPCLQSLIPGSAAPAGPKPGSCSDAVRVFANLMPCGHNGAGHYPYAGALFSDQKERSLWRCAWPARRANAGCVGWIFGPSSKGDAIGWDRLAVCERAPIKLRAGAHGLVFRPSWPRVGSERDYRALASVRPLQVE